MVENTIRLLLDKSTLFGKTLAGILKKDIRIKLINYQFDEENIIEIVQKNNPSVILIDTDFCFEKAPLIIKLIKENFPTIKVISLYLWNKSLLQEKMLEAGADTHLSKFDHGANIIEAIKKRELKTILF
ncbi:MAG: hypothetical protein COA97_09070 [Flavobacteriales bacterium]|nr:MAG: hypothetical protein COA97_09070 [Flavobacteriales bacterium]